MPKHVTAKMSFLHIQKVAGRCWNSQNCCEVWDLGE